MNDNDEAYIPSFKMLTELVFIQHITVNKLKVCVPGPEEEYKGKSIDYPNLKDFTDYKGRENWH